MEYDSYPEPMAPWAYVWLSLLYAIPAVGLAYLLIHTFSRQTSPERRSFAASRLLLRGLFLGALCLAVLVLLMCGALGDTLHAIVSGIAPLFTPGK